MTTEQSEACQPPLTFKAMLETSEKAAKGTSRPWNVADTFHDEGEPFAILGDTSELKGSTVRKGSSTSVHVATVYSEADANLIVRSVNAYNALMRACKSALKDESTSSETAEQCRKAISIGQGRLHTTPRTTS